MKKALFLVNATGLRPLMASFINVLLLVGITTQFASPYAHALDAENCIKVRNTFKDFDDQMEKAYNHGTLAQMTATAVAGGAVLNDKQSDSFYNDVNGLADELEPAFEPLKTLVTIAKSENAKRAEKEKDKEKDKKDAKTAEYIVLPLRIQVLRDKMFSFYIKAARQLIKAGGCVTQENRAECQNPPLLVLFHVKDKEKDVEINPYLEMKTSVDKDIKTIREVFLKYNCGDEPEKK